MNDTDSELCPAGCVSPIDNFQHSGNRPDMSNCTVSRELDFQWQFCMLNFILDYVQNYANKQGGCNGYYPQISCLLCLKQLCWPAGSYKDT